MEANIMSKISEAAERQNARFDQIETAVTGIADDIKILNEMIETLQTTPGPITPEDQATLDALEARGAALAEKLTALDAANPPPPSVV